MENKELKKVFFLGVSNEERHRYNLAYSNFIYSLCYYCISKMQDKFDLISFNRHDMVDSSNIRNSVFQHIVTNDILIFLLDEMPLTYNDGEKGENTIPMYNPNVWFELGIAAPQLEKPIIVISRDMINPFYASDIRTCVVTSQLENFYFLDNVSMFNVGQVTDEKKEEWLQFWKTELARIDRSMPHHELVNFVNTLSKKLVHGTNPFANDVTISDFSNLLSPIGTGSIYELLKNYVASTVATFYPGEKNAFTQLTKAVKAADSSLKTTRFANRSIVSGLEKNVSYHNAFMEQLYTKSRSHAIGSERIICNNGFTKWKDIYMMLLNGGNVKIFIRKNDYSTNFELVIVDGETTFIHFYQLSIKGKKNDDGTENVQDHQVINSTLKLEGRDVAEHMSEVFERLYQREPGDPSRTLLGIPTEDELQKIAKEKRNVENWRENGILQLNSGSPNGSKQREREVMELLVKSYIKWHPYMSVKQDRVNMGLGLCLLVSNTVFLQNLIDFIKSTQFFEEFVTESKKEWDEVKKQLNVNNAYQELDYQFSLVFAELEKQDGVH